MRDRYRWTICALLFAAITINYVDRQTIALLKPILSTTFHWNDVDYGNIVFAFTLAYGIGALVAGRVIDKLGTFRGFTFVVTFWSLAAAAHAVASSVTAFITARFALGLGESGAFPVSVKAVSEWYPQDERSFATGVFNAGTSIGTIVTPLFLPFIVADVGWRWSFVVTAALGLIWLVAWLRYYRAPAVTHVATPSSRLSWGKVLRYRQGWAFAAGKFFIDPVWFLYLFWLPDFLHRTHGLDLSGFGLPIAIVYICAGLGSISLGWLPGALIRRGWSANIARKGTMFVCALAVIPTLFVAGVTSLWLAVAIIGLATAAHQGFSANLFTLPSDTFESQDVGSVTGLGSMAGAFGGMLIALVVAQILQRTGSYVPVFFIPTGAYFIALVLIHVLSPKLERVAE